MTRAPGRRSIVVLALLIAGVAAGLRLAWLTADPPSEAPVGIVWHDEGAWVHNARNKALWGVWRTDEWNPVFLAPVFTALEYGAFRALGVGTWQARMVPALSGLVAVAAIGLGLAALSGRRAGLVGAALLATSFFFVMWNRAALMESTMTAAIVASWAAYAGAHARRPAWGLAAGGFAVIAFFTKAAAAFYLVAIAVDAAAAWIVASSPAVRLRLRMPAPPASSGPAARWTLAGLALASTLALVAFVIPWWTEFRFYNWEMSVTRKPEYTVRALLDRASWLPVIHDVFTRMWPVLIVSMVALLALVARWRTAPPALRLLGLWLLFGLAELVVHDSGNERRYVMLVPALLALAAWRAARDDRTETAAPVIASRWLLAPILLLAGYLVAGSLIRVIDLQRIYGHEIGWAVRASAVVALAFAGGALWRGRWLARLVGAGPWRPTMIAAFVGLVIVSDAVQYAHWARARTDLNYRASIALRTMVPAGTLVHGKLANGLSLENHIRPVFVGRGFGNHADRLDRTDVRYLLTYVSPRVGYEGPVIVDVLDHLPGYRILTTFPVQETAGEDRAALIDKFPER